MTAVTQPIPQPLGQAAAVPADYNIWRLRVDQYHEMVRSGILTEDDPVELLEGWLVAKMTKSPRHRLSTRATRLSLERLVPSGWYVEAQEPITTTDSEPEPDVAVIRGDPHEYADRHPGPGEVALIVEVADTSLPRDRTSKKRLYARAGIPIYWIVNLVEQQVEVYTNPTGDDEEPDYRQRQDFTAEDEVPLVVEGREVARILVGELLP
jgi:Uma2 family endonuclease